MTFSRRDELGLVVLTMLLVTLAALIRNFVKQRKRLAIRKTMISEAVVAGAIVSVIVCALLSTCIIFFSINKDRRRRRRTNVRQRRITRSQLLAQPDESSVYSISGRQITHDNAYLSADHVTVVNESNKPPKYDDAPPSYDEALKLAMANSRRDGEGAS